MEDVARNEGATGPEADADGHDEGALLAWSRALDFDEYSREWTAAATDVGAELPL